MNWILRLYRILLQILCTPIFLSDFFTKETGADYGIRLGQKWDLVFKMIRNNTRIISGSSFIEHLTMATTLMRLPKNLEGVVVECGTYKGVSAANLSLVCSLVGRRLEIFDSFEGLPAPTAKDKSHTLLSSKEIHTYDKGAWCGRLEEVEQNIARYGRLEVCRFHRGFFDQTLPAFKEKCAQAFVDVDYVSSLETCLKYLWPLLADGAYLYTHEAGHMEIASLFFSESWWRENLSTLPPGLVGAGSGIGIKILSGSFFSSSLGYTVKNRQSLQYTEVPQAGGMKLGFEAASQLTEPNSKHWNPARQQRSPAPDRLEPIS